jgi:hypothetical protein
MIEVNTNNARATEMNIRPQSPTTAAREFWVRAMPSPSKPGV